ncbi:MAG: shikimate dehydrogenase [Proteobacteria bacterium]|jgi:shikimate dehydrogenase|nr:shikimate dehydrogenase [Alphaproteobacteria bacterium]NCC03623.1 shikimate dehydrogenase [Pseudomonadota bacterium]
MSRAYLTGKAKLAGVIGYPIAHTKSPLIHGYWLNKHDIDGVYMPLRVHPDQLEQALRALPVLGFRGCNLTIPHKELAIKIVDQLTSLARRVGAANTIIVSEDGRLIGDNTDVFGFVENLKSGGFDLHNTNAHVVVLGAGGAARGIVVALQELGAKKITIVNRSAERAETLCRELNFGGEMECASWDQRNNVISDASLVVNATSLGMTGQQELDIDLTVISPTAWVTDAVYTPLKTGLLKKAEEKGCRVIDGLGMLLHQARPGFEAWFGQKVDVTAELRDLVLHG